MSPKFHINQQVLITADQADLPMPQCLYAGQAGVIKSIGMTHYYVAPLAPLSGADSAIGIQFLPIELTAVHPRVTVEKRRDDWMAYLDGDRTKWERGGSAMEAIERLEISFPKELED
jgi:hypothetical protein